MSRISSIADGIASSGRGSQQIVSTKNILFVDDEPRVLRAIERGLRKKRDLWTMSFAKDAEDALSQMAETRFDVVVSDISMPKTNGVTLLREVRERYPDTVRILMSGTTDGDIVMRAVPVAHRFLAKPWDRLTLHNEIGRALELRDLMESSAVRAIVGSISSLPSLPGVYTDLCAALENPKSRSVDIINVVERDPAVVARLLHIVNSAFFAVPRALHSASDAVRYLGTARLKSLLLSAEVFSSCEQCALPNGFSLSDFQNHALLTGKIAAGFVEDNKDAALTAGLLHSIGKLIFASHMPAAWGQVWTEAHEQERPLAEVETEHFQTNYAQVGGYLLGIWGLPQDLVEAVALHINPLDYRGHNRELIAAVHLASHLAAQELGLSFDNYNEDLLDTLQGGPASNSWLGGNVRDLPSPPLE